ncbi:transcription factor A, mitochondrial [Danaus plexippus]|nr:transcription factor A, mitochondrial [Danaus plexippus]
MSPFNNMFRLSNVITGSYKTVLLGRVSYSPSQICCYTKKSAEAKLGIDKPKRPLTPFFKFMGQMRPALLAKNPGISSKEAISWSSKHWQQLDSETKSQMLKEYEKDLEDYKKIKAIYESSLTDQQKEDIQKMKEDMVAAKEKRKLKAEYKELGRPKKPMSSYFLFCQTKKDLFKGQKIQEFQTTLKAEWVKLSDSERVKYEKQAQELMNKYRKDLQAWELKMISIGRSDLVKEKPVRSKSKSSQ